MSLVLCGTAIKCLRVSEGGDYESCLRVGVGRLLRVVFEGW